MIRSVFIVCEYYISIDLSNKAGLILLTSDSMISELVPINIIHMYMLKRADHLCLLVKSSL